MTTQKTYFVVIRQARAKQLVADHHPQFLETTVARCEELGQAMQIACALIGPMADMNHDEQLAFNDDLTSGIWLNSHVARAGVNQQVRVKTINRERG